DSLRVGPVAPLEGPERCYRVESGLTDVVIRAGRHEPPQHGGREVRKIRIVESRKSRHTEELPEVRVVSRSPLFVWSLPSQYSLLGPQGTGSRAHAHACAGIASQVFPRSSRPVRFLKTPPHCLKKNGTPDVSH